MKLLMLGGTVFLGRHIVEAALARGHEVTLFNRGQHNPDLFPGVEKLQAHRSLKSRADFKNRQSSGDRQQERSPKGSKSVAEGEKEA